MAGGAGARGCRNKPFDIVSNPQKLDLMFSLSESVG